MTVREYANLHQKTTQAVYRLIKQGRIMTDTVENHTVILPGTPWPDLKQPGKRKRGVSAPLPQADPPVESLPTRSGGEMAGQPQADTVPMDRATGDDDGPEIDV